MDARGGLVDGLALCAGVGGLELGLLRALGGRYRTVGAVERESFAASCLVEGVAAERLGAFPVWDDLATFRGSEWRGAVDLVSAGLPCQPYSVAGKLRGNSDERALWPEFVRIVEECEPAACFIENTPRFLKYFGPCYEELRRMGFVCAEPLFLTASELGAPHIRRRVFILAGHPDRWHARVGPAHANRRAVRDEPREGQAWPGGAAVADDAHASADADGGGREDEWRGWVFDPERQTLRHDADRCSDRCRTCGTSWSVESPAVRVADGFPDWMDRLRVLGNAVAPDMAEVAWSLLADTLNEEFTQ